MSKEAPIQHSFWIIVSSDKNLQEKKLHFMMKYSEAGDRAGLHYISVTLCIQHF